MIGRDAAVLFVESLPPRYGKPFEGCIYIPKSIRADHPLVARLGWENAIRMVRVFGGEMLKPSRCAGVRRAERDAAIISMSSSGVSTQCIAREFRISDRQVRNIVKEIPPVAGNDNSSNNRAA